MDEDANKQHQQHRKKQERAKGEKHDGGRRKEMAGRRREHEVLVAVDTVAVTITTRIVFVICFCLYFNLSQ